MSESTTPRKTLDLTAEIVSAHVGNNQVPVEALPALIQEVYRTLAGVTLGSAAAIAVAEKLQPAVPVKRSVFPDYIVCLEDGKKFKMLKRHLQTAYNMTPQQYRKRWGLPSNYPMVAPSYTDRRSSIAKSLGFGKKTPSVELAEEPKSEPIVTEVKARRVKGSRG